MRSLCLRANNAGLARLLGWMIAFGVCASKLGERMERQNRTIGLPIALALGVATAILCGTSAVGSPTIYGIGGGNSPGELYLIPPTNGSGGDVGPIDGFQNISAMAYAPSGVLYAAGQD